MRKAMDQRKGKSGQGGPSMSSEEEVTLLQRLEEMIVIIMYCLLSQELAFQMERTWAGRNCSQTM